MNLNKYIQSAQLKNSYKYEEEYNIFKKKLFGDLKYFELFICILKSHAHLPF